MKTILVATDYSNAATNALNYAAALARETEAKIILYNAFQLPVHAANTLLSATGVSELIDENKRRLRSLATSISRQFGIKVESISNISYVAEEIGFLVKKMNVDLVVMGMKGKETDSGFFGSVTTYVIGEASYPVLVVPEEAGYKGIEKILFACDYNCLHPENKLPILKELAVTYRAEVEVLHVNKVVEPVEAGSGSIVERSVELEEILDGIHHIYRDVSDEHILNGIERGVREYGADLLVMVPHHTGFWNMIFNRSKTRKMALKTQVPLLSIPYKGMNIHE